jgi:hypothetical protein
MEGISEFEVIAIGITIYVTAERFKLEAAEV